MIRTAKLTNPNYHTLTDGVLYVIRNLVGSKATFSAYDVTLQARIDNPTTDIYHRDVRDMVHYFFDNGHSVFADYERQDNGTYQVYTPKTQQQPLHKHSFKLELK